MPLWNPPAEMNGIPLSERSRWLVFGPIKIVVNPRRLNEINPFVPGGWLRDALDAGRAALAAEKPHE